MQIKKFPNVAVAATKLNILNILPSGSIIKPCTLKLFQVAILAPRLYRLSNNMVSEYINTRCSIKSMNTMSPQQLASGESQFSSYSHLIIINFMVNRFMIIPSKLFSRILLVILSSIVTFDMVSVVRANFPFVRNQKDDGWYCNLNSNKYSCKYIAI